MASRRLVVLLEGTGNSPEAVDKVWKPTNVQHLREFFIKQEIMSKIEENADEGWEVHRGASTIVYYDRGLGAPLGEKDNTTILGKIVSTFSKNSNPFQSVQGQVIAIGIGDNVSQAYKFLSKYYAQGDQIYMFGFSRGAYTARLLTSFIRYIGLVKSDPFRNGGKLDENKLKQKIEEGFRLYGAQGRPQDATNAINFRNNHSHNTNQIINFLGLWDTVRGYVAEQIPADGKLSSIVKTARHAVSIDERRPIFKPELWIPYDHNDSQQVWFPGVHCDIGGGYVDRRLSDITLKWMIDEANKSGLGIDTNREFYKTLSPLETGTQHDSFNARIQDSAPLTWNQVFKGNMFRRAVCQSTRDESLHDSVLKRFGKEVKVENESKKYLPSNLVQPLHASRNLQSSLSKIVEPIPDEFADLDEKTSLILSSIKAKL